MAMTAKDTSSTKRNVRMLRSGIKPSTSGPANIPVCKKRRRNKKRKKRKKEKKKKRKKINVADLKKNKIGVSLYNNLLFFLAVYLSTNIL